MPVMHTSHGFLTDAARLLFKGAGYLAPRYLLSRFIPQLREPWDRQIDVTVATAAYAIDTYIAGWLILEAAISITLLSGASLGPWAVMVNLVVLWRVFDIVQVTMNVYLFDVLNGRSNLRVASRARLIVLAGINFVEIMICFGVSYSLHPRLLSEQYVGSGFYLSAITQLTIGYGDVHPWGWLRGQAVLQGLIGSAFLILVFARIVGSFQTFTDEPGPQDPRDE